MVIFVSLGIQQEIKMKNMYQLIILLLLIGCSADIPNEQQNFIDKWQSLKEMDNKSGGNEHLKLNTSQVIKWFGEVISGSDNSVLVDYKGIEYTLYPGISLQNRSNNLASLENGDEVYFTGTLNGEKSFTLGGMLRAPEMKVICKKLTNIDETIIYYEITLEEIVAANKAAVEAKAAAERRSRMCRLDGCTRDGNGWDYYSESQGSAFGVDFVGCVRKYTTGGYCSKDHCWQDH